ncbi:MAG TPA: gliding motility-associated ABC transporter ATP-binding subunit GldA [Bacteroidales bacterium]|nr:gliding motility-associated ABC transporter ATP-binding subunit GldA [Bacteroidales bacterium]
MSIVVENVTKFYGEQKALNNVSFEIKTGEIVGFLGPNGAGKSTMMKIITGYIPASNGTVKINGKEVGEENIEIRRQIGYLPENNPLYPEMFIREYLQFVSSFYGKVSAKLVEDIMDVTGLLPEKKKKIGSLSKGYKQRVGLAQALIHNPSILILDEPTTGLDPNQILEIRNLIREAGKAKTVMLSTHIMQEVEAICDRVIIIDKGIIVANEEKSRIYSIINRKKQIVTVEFDKTVEEKGLDDLKNQRITGKKIKNNIYQFETEEETDIRPLLFQFSVSNNLTVLSMQKVESNLEEVFRHFTT